MDEPSAFDEFGSGQQNAPAARRRPASDWLNRVLQGVSFAGLWIAMAAAICVVGLHLFHAVFGPAPEGGLALKSAVPLMVVGVAYLSLIATVPRTWSQRVLGILVGLAFILWGVEQFLKDPRWIGLIDDFVVLLFVLDLSIVIRQNLKISAAERRRRREVESPRKGE